MVNNNLLIASQAGDSERGKIFGITSSIQSLGQTIAPVVGGVCASMISYTAPFYLSAVFIFIASILIWRYE